ncbi:MAG: hypothetical protein ACK4TA_19260 [Saprospiraceae bacterium]
MHYIAPPAWAAASCCPPYRNRHKIAPDDADFGCPAAGYWVGSGGYVPILPD